MKDCGHNMGRRKNAEEIDREFKILVNNLIPMSLDQAEWICGKIERLLKRYPYLRAKLEELCKSDDSWVVEQLTRTLSEMKRRRKDQ